MPIGERAVRWVTWNHFLLEERTVTAPLATAPVLEAKGPVTVPSKSRLKLHTEILSRVIGVFRFTYASR